MGDAVSATAELPKTPDPEFRALWVDGFHAGIRTPKEAERLVADAKKAKFNVLIVQVRRHGDAFYRQSFEPPPKDIQYDPQFDPLAFIIDLAHREGLEVDAWVNTMMVWGDHKPPGDPRHVFNQHGIEHAGEDNWLTQSPKGSQSYPLGYFLDAGHPAAADYVASVCANVVEKYRVDGIHLDFIRYPEVQKLSKGAPVGYNPVSVARFRRSTGRLDTPEPGDAQWSAWRRQQITQLVRRIYLESKALNPKIRVSAALIASGEPPSGEKGFKEVRAVRTVFQDWHGWLKEGILDLAIPMNYAREDNPRARGWFNSWIRWEKRHKHGRQLAVGLAAYVNQPQETLAQLQRVRRAEGRDKADGAAFFSYANLQKRFTPALKSVSANDTPEEQTEPALSTILSSDSEVFPEPTALPAQKESTGWLAGTVHHSQQPADGATVVLRQKGWLRRARLTQADGNGFFGFVDLKPGHYRVRAGSEPVVEIEIIPGQVTRAGLGKR